MKHIPLNLEAIAKGISFVPVASGEAQMVCSHTTSDLISPSAREDDTSLLSAIVSLAALILECRTPLLKI